MKIISNRRKKLLKADESGFTLFEILIATTVFTLMLIVITVSVINISNSFYKGITIATTNNTARNIIDNLTQAIQDNGGSITPINSTTDGTTGITTAGFCVGSVTRYSYLLNYVVKQGISGANSTTLEAPDGLVVDNMGGGCNSSKHAQNLGANNVNISATSKELLSTNTRLLVFPVPSLVGTSCLSSSDQCLYQVAVKVIYGDKTQFSTPNPTPTSVCNLNAGAQFCSVEYLSTFVQKRVQ